MTLSIFNVQNAKEKTTLRPKIRKSIKKNLKSKNSVLFVEATRFTRRLNKLLILQASSSSGRVPVSKTGCWGFKSLLACHFSVNGVMK